jgi:hypothetical protein
LTDSDFLFTVAEVGVAFAGFAGLVTILARRLGQGTESQAEVHLLYRMLLVSMLTVAAALVPYLPFRFGASEPQAWRISSGVFFAGWLLYFVNALRGILTNLDATNPPGGRFLLFFNQLVHLGAGIALLTAAVGLWGSAAPAVYLAALCAMLYMAGCLFVILFTRLSQS